MAVHQVNPQGGRLAALDPIWGRIRSEAEAIIHHEPELATFIFSTVLHHDRLEAAVVHRLADRLDHSAISGDLIRQTYYEALRDDPDIGNAFRADAIYRKDVLDAVPFYHLDGDVSGPINGSVRWYVGVEDRLRTTHVDAGLQIGR